MGAFNTQDNIQQKTSDALTSANALRDYLSNQLIQTYRTELQDDYQPGLFGTAITEINFIKSILAKPIFTSPLTTSSDIYQFRNELDEIRRQIDKNEYKRVQTIYRSNEFISLINTANELWNQSKAEVDKQSKIIENEIKILQHSMALEQESLITQEEKISVDAVDLLKSNYQFHQTQIANYANRLKATTGNNDDFSVFYEQLTRRLLPNIDSKNRLLDYQEQILTRKQDLWQLEVARTSYLPPLKNANEISLLKYLFAKSLLLQYFQDIQAEEKAIYWRYSLKAKSERQVETLMFGEIETRENWYQKAYNSDVFFIQQQENLALQSLLPESDQFDSTLESIQLTLPAINKIATENNRVVKYAGVRAFNDKTEEATVKLMEEMAYGFDKIEGKPQNINLPHLDNIIASHNANLAEIKLARIKSQPTAFKITPRLNAATSHHSPVPATPTKGIKKIISQLLDNEDVVFGSGVALGVGIGIGIGIALSFVTFGGSIIVGAFIGGLVGGFCGGAAGEAVNQTREAHKKPTTQPPVEKREETIEKPTDTTESIVATPAPHLDHVHNSEADVYHRLADKNHPQNGIIQDNRLFLSESKKTEAKQETLKNRGPKPATRVSQSPNEEDKEGDSKTKSEGETHPNKKHL